jgi:hypothetical protein
VLLAVLGKIAKEGARAIAAIPSAIALIVFK